MSESKNQILKTKIPKGYRTKFLNCYAYIHKKNFWLWENGRGNLAIYSTKEEAERNSTMNMQETGELTEVNISYSYIENDEIKSFLTKQEI